ncbi:MAG: DUF4268 domain-containing protein [Firmicutes bacterium]|nr:DUF4268 domain-containing protein [Bacillota bacterium]
MFKINTETNSIEEIPEKSFSELGFSERKHLQEWLTKTPSALGEELLIIQKEFDGFDETRERLDLLALDKQGSLVVIENKLDDSGRDTVWQALKYASYCSTLSKTKIIEIYQTYLNKHENSISAETKLTEFFGSDDIADIKLNEGQNQRIFLVAGSFRKEVTSTVLWLLNYNIQLQCFKVTPYQMEDKLLLDVEQIIPLKETKEYTIRIAEKNSDEIQTITEQRTSQINRNNFWKYLLEYANKKCNLYQNISPSKDSWISTGSGISGISYNISISRENCRVELYMQRPNAQDNKIVFEYLLKEKDEIENKFGEPLIWLRLDNKKACRIKCEMQGVNYYNKEDWKKMAEFLTDRIMKLEQAMREPLAKVAKQLKGRE